MTQASSRSLSAAKALYFLYYAAGSALIPYLPLYYRTIGFDGNQIGVLTSITPAVALVGSPLLSGVADATRRHKWVLVGSLVGTATAAVALSQADTFWTLAAMVAIYAFFNAPVMPLIDNAVMALLGSQRDRYGTLRLWGAVGWGIAATLFGSVSERYGLI